MCILNNSIATWAKDTRKPIKFILCFHFYCWFPLYAFHSLLFFFFFFSLVLFLFCSIILHIILYLMLWRFPTVFSHLWAVIGLPSSAKELYQLSILGSKRNVPLAWRLDSKVRTQVTGDCILLNDSWNCLRCVLGGRSSLTKLSQVSFSSNIGIIHSLYSWTTDKRVGFFTQARLIPKWDSLNICDGMRCSGSERHAGTKTWQRAHSGPWV